MKFGELATRVDSETPKDGSEIYIDVVDGDNVKTVRCLGGMETSSGKCVFVSAPYGGSCIDFESFRRALVDKASEFADFDCVLKSDDSDVTIPLRRVYTTDGEGAFVLDGDFREFDRNDPTVEREVFYTAHYGNRTDCIRELFHVLACLNMSFACPTRDIRYTKTGKELATLRARVRGTATRHYDLFNGSYFVPDKKSYITAGIKW